jgi:hypothetical protein
MLLGAAYARTAAQSSGSSVKVGGILFGDTKDGGQYYTLNPGGQAPSSFGTDARYGNATANKQAAGNYAFFQEYGKAAMKSLGPGWKLYDLLASDQGGIRAWNFNATAKSQITGASQALADDILDAIGQTGAATTPAKIVVYSAGGGANVAGETIGYLLNQGYSIATLLKHFVVVQHGNNWVTNYENAARDLTREFTVAISNQNYASYANGDPGPDLKHALTAKVTGDTVFADAFDKALAVATGGQAFANLPSGATFKTTLDASDAGSHAFAANPAALLAAMASRLASNEGLQEGYDWAHLIDTGSGTRLREIVSNFDAAAISKLLWGSSGAKPGSPAAPPAPGPDAGPGAPEGGTGVARTVLSLASGNDDRETLGGSTSIDLDLGMNTTPTGKQANHVTLHFGDLAAAGDGEGDGHGTIESAYLLFEAKRSATAEGHLTITAAGTAADTADGESVDWAPGAWTAGGSYRSADVSALVEAALADGDDAITFDITGSGTHVAHAFEANGGPQLIIDWHLA